MLQLERWTRKALFVGVACATTACSDGKDAAAANGPLVTKQEPARPAQCGALGSFVGDGGEALGALAGCAIFVETPSELGQQTFALVLSNGALASPSHRVHITRIGGRPDVGSYAVGSGEFLGQLTIVQSSVYSVRPYPNVDLAGTLVILSSTSAGVTGTIDLRGVDASGASITITGAFDAACVQASGARC